MDTQENLVSETDNFVTNKQRKRLKSDLAVCSPTDELFVPSFFWPFVKRLVPTRTPCTYMSPGETFSFYFLYPELFLYDFGEMALVFSSHHIALDVVSDCVHNGVQRVSKILSHRRMLRKT